MTAVAHYLTWLEAMHAEAARLRHQEVEPEHGLASLLLDGPLAGEFSSTEDRIDFARGVVGLAGVPEVVGG